MNISDQDKTIVLCYLKSFSYLIISNNWCLQEIMVYLAAIRIRERQRLERISKTISFQPQLVACCLRSVLDKTVFQIFTSLRFCSLNKNTLNMDHWCN